MPVLRNVQAMDYADVEKEITNAYNPVLFVMYTGPGGAGAA
jgi:hypothetical protein